MYGVCVCVWQCTRPTRPDVTEIIAHLFANVEDVVLYESSNTPEVNTSRNIPVHKSVNTSVNAPATAPVNTSVNTSVDMSVDTLVDTPMNTPVNTSMNKTPAPTSTPAE